MWHQPQHDRRLVSVTGCTGACAAHPAGAARATPSQCRSRSIQDVRAPPQWLDAGADGTRVGTRHRTPLAPQYLFARAPHDRLDAKQTCLAYIERDEAQRVAFRQQLRQIAPHNRVDVDEAGVDDTLCYPYGWSPRTTQCHGQRLGHRTTRGSMAAAWCGGTVLAPLTLEGYGDAQLIEAWVAQQVVNELQPGQTVIVDNASLHRIAPLRALLAHAHCFVLPLPP